MAAQSILLLNGPNLDMLGMREPDVYGTETLGSLEEMTVLYAHQRGVRLSCFQSNSESELIGKIQGSAGRYDGIVYNPGAHTHYSYALRDAIASVDVPVVEVHISDIDEREAFRRVSVIAPACVAQVKGLGFDGYCRAIDILCDNEGLARLGEGFESRFPAGECIIVSGSKPEAQGSGQRAAEPRPEEAGEPEGPAGFASAAPAAPVEPAVPAEPATPAPPAEPAAPAVPATPAAHAVPAVPISPAEPAAPAALESPAAPAASATPAASAEPAFRPEELEDSEDPEEPEDFAEPYAQDVAAVDAGLVSFERQNLVRATCARLGIDALLVRDTSNIRWITAFDGVFDEERAHALLVTRGFSVLHTDSRYSNAIRRVAQRISSDIALSDERMSHVQFAGAVLAPGGAPFQGRLGIEDTITYAEFAKVAAMFGTGGLVATTDVVAGLRAVKSGPELSRMLAAQAVTDAAFEHIVRFIRPGMTEREVQLELDGYMLRHGGEGLSFPTIVATGANGADPHAVPGNTRLEAGQCLVMDFGAKAFGYCSDMTRTVFLGQPDPKMAAAWATLCRANETVEALLRPGVTGRAAQEVAERVLAEGGFGGTMGHGLGHGVGIDVHELPVLNAKSEVPLVVGNVVTVEPGIYLPGEFGMRLEDCGVVTQNGYEAFSQLGHEMIVL